MRHVGGEAALEFLITLDAFRHGVKRFGELGDFVFAIEVHASRKIAFLDFLRRFRDAVNGAHQATREHNADKRRKGDREHGGKTHALVALHAEFLIGLRKQQIAAINPNLDGADNLPIVKRDGRRGHLAVGRRK